MDSSLKEKYQKKLKKHLTFSETAPVSKIPKKWENQIHSSLSIKIDDFDENVSLSDLPVKIVNFGGIFKIIGFLYVQEVNEAVSKLLKITKIRLPCPDYFRKIVGLEKISDFP